MRIDFKCRHHQTNADATRNKCGTYTLRCEEDGVEASLPVHVLGNLLKTDAINGMVQQIILSDARADEILRDCWPDVPDDFSFTPVFLPPGSQG